MSVRRGEGGDGGFTLIELLVTVVIMGLAVAALMGGLGTAIIVSDQHRQQAVAGAAVRSYAEAVLGQTYTNCATASTFSSPSGFTLPTGYSRTVSVKYWNATSRTFVSNCSTDAGAQLVSLRVASASGRGVGTLDVVLRRAGA